MAKEEARSIAFWLRVGSSMKSTSSPSPSLRHSAGAARSLLNAVLRDETASGARTALLEVRASNLAARAFYASTGFVAVGQRPRYYANGEDALLMTRST